MNFAKLTERFRVEKARGFRLSDFDPADTCGLDIGKAAAKDMIADGLRHLTAMQEMLYAQDRWALLIILQGMDASGKDGVAGL
jgi:polyphosphate kinase 2 (PPK2 family)